ncbi:MAG: putative glycoside hydrolase [Lachnospiraceae bacterium]|nr:putative glycoside hydrolase [Lachnospiraceae bacterium]
MGNRQNQKMLHIAIRIICAVILVIAVVSILKAKGVFSQKQNMPATVSEETDTSDKADLPENNAPAEEEATAVTPEAVAEEQEAEPEELTPAENLKAYLENDPRTPAKAKGIYVTGPIAGTVNTFPELEELVGTTELNTMVIDIKNDSGEITYKIDNELAKEIGADIRYIPNPEELIKRLKEEGIYLIARVVAFKDPLLAEKKPEFAIKNPDGTVFHDSSDLAWVNPYKKEYWDYLLDVSKAAVELGFDEIQYDYIRFSTAKGISEADFGPEANTMTREEAVNGFLTYAYENLAPLGVYVSVDVFGTIITNKTDGELIGQNFTEMAKHCDYICPMVYPSHYVETSYGIDIPDANPHDLIFAAMTDAVNVLNEEADKTGERMAKLRPWYQAFTASWVNAYISYTGKDLRSQITVGEEAGVDEWFMWNAVNSYVATQDGLHKEN